MGFGIILKKFQLLDILTVVLVRRAEHIHFSMISEFAISAMFYAYSGRPHNTRKHPFCSLVGYTSVSR